MTGTRPVSTFRRLVTKIRASKTRDLFLGSIVEPALEEFGLKVVRADRIGKPGMITAQIIEHVLKAKLVIAEYVVPQPQRVLRIVPEARVSPTYVQIIRRSDRIPFDLDQFRTIQIDTASIFTMVPNLQTYRAGSPRRFAWLSRIRIRRTIP